MLGPRASIDPNVRSLLYIPVKNFFCEENLLQYFVDWTYLHEEFVVIFAALSWEDPQEIATTLLLSNCLTDDFLVSNAIGFFKWVNQMAVLIWIILSLPFN